MKEVFEKKLRNRADRALRIIEHVCQVAPERWASLYDTLTGAETRATVLSIHGGPSGMYVKNSQAASSTSDAQHYAADGYVVLLPNPRGSSVYGESGSQAVVGYWGGMRF